MAQFVLSLIGISALLIVLLTIPLAMATGEVQIGFDWLALKHSLSKKWFVVRRDDIISITLLSEHGSPI